MSLEELKLFKAVINKLGFLTVDGASEFRFAFTVSPAVEKTRSDGALAAGMDNIVLASNDNLGLTSFNDFHQAKI